MRATFRGRLNRPAVVAIGCWDPFSPRHAALAARMRQYTLKQGFLAMAVAIDPDPVSLLMGADFWPPFDSIDSRIRRLEAVGFDSTIKLRFGRSDLTRGAKEVMSIIADYVEVRELWLGARQSLGQGSLGSQAAIMELGRTMGFAVHRLGARSLSARESAARDWLRAGDIERAIVAAGHAPTWRRPRSGFLKLPWPSGTYRCLSAQDPVNCSRREVLERRQDSKFMVELVEASKGVRLMAWPATATAWIVFVSGPANANDDKHNFT